MASLRDDANEIRRPTSAERSRRTSQRTKLPSHSTELPELLRAIDKYVHIGDKQTALALRLLALTFVRTAELIGAEWPELDPRERARRHG